jgi:hypothetical protein
MTEAEKVGLVEDILAIWGEDAARELAAHYGVALQALELAPAAAPAVTPEASSSPYSRANEAVRTASSSGQKGKYQLAGASALVMILAVIVGSPLPFRPTQMEAGALQERSSDPPVVTAIAFVEPRETSAAQGRSGSPVQIEPSAPKGTAQAPHSVAAAGLTEMAAEPVRALIAETASPSLQPASEQAGSRSPERNLSDPDQARAVQQRLAELGFFHVSATGVWGANSRQALTAFKAQAQLPVNDTWDEAVEHRLFSAEVPSSGSFVGQWAPSAQACSSQPGRSGLLPATINEQAARAGETTCRFGRKKQIGTAWTMVATCSDQRSRWTANVRLDVRGDRLTWSSERGSQTYVRCHQGQLLAQVVN